MNSDFKLIRQLAIAAPIFFMLASTGCVLPGGLTPVGGQHVKGWIKDSDGNGIANQKLVLVQGHFDCLDAETIEYVVAPADEWQLQRVELITDADGYFSHKLRGFTHCHPRWIIPPLGSLPSKLSGNADHGKFFILHTSDTEGGTYEVRLKGENAAVLKWNYTQQRRQRIKPEIDPERINAAVETIEEVDKGGYSRATPKVILEIVRRR